MQIWPHSRMDLKKEIRIRGCIVLTHPLFFLFPGKFVEDADEWGDEVPPVPPDGGGVTLKPQH